MIEKIFQAVILFSMTIVIVSGAIWLAAHLLASSGLR